MPSLFSRVRSLRAELAVVSGNPLARELAAVIPPEANEITTNCLCDLLGVRHTSGMARQIAKAMVELGWLPFRQKKATGLRPFRPSLSQGQPTVAHLERQLGEECHPKQIGHRHIRVDRSVNIAHRDFSNSDFAEHDLCGPRSAGWCACRTVYGICFAQPEVWKSLVFETFPVSAS